MAEPRPTSEESPIPEPNEPTTSGTGAAPRDSSIHATPLQLGGSLLIGLVLFIACGILFGFVHAWVDDVFARLEGPPARSTRTSVPAAEQTARVARIATQAAATLPANPTREEGIAHLMANLAASKPQSHLAAYLEGIEIDATSSRVTFTIRQEIPSTRVWSEITYPLILGTASLAARQGWTLERIEAIYFTPEGGVDEAWLDGEYILPLYNQEVAFEDVAAYDSRDELTPRPVAVQTARAATRTAVAPPTLSANPTREERLTHMVSLLASEKPDATLVEYRNEIKLDVTEERVSFTIEREISEDGFIEIAATLLYWTAYLAGEHGWTLEEIEVLRSPVRGERSRAWLEGEDILPLSRDEVELLGVIQFEAR